MEILNILNRHYSIAFDALEMLRDGGSAANAVFSGGDKYFLRVIKPAFFDTAAMGADVQVFLQGKGFPVPPIIFTKDNKPYVRANDGLLILYEFIEGGEAEPEHDAEAVSELVGRLHHEMKSYPGELIKRDKHFYIGKYIDILKEKQYPKVDEFQAYGNALWGKIKDLPRGFCHGDMYCGNVHKTPDGSFYVLDFDTSCEGFPMYDIALFCNKTDYFDYDERGYGQSKEVLSRFLPGYFRHDSLSQAEIDVFYDLLALYHFALQATIIEMHGLDCVDNAFLDNQLDWLYRWREQCRR